MQGSIVALTPAKDKFATACIVATVAARPRSGLELTPPEIDIYFSRPEDIQIDPQEEWVMLESKQGYFEAHRHTLRAIQKMGKERSGLNMNTFGARTGLTCDHSFPLAEHVCSLSPDIAPPAYLQENPVLSLQAASNREQKAQYQAVDIINQWPEPPAETLDASQWMAMRQIITKKLAIVQGPPGTGKTHVSKVALQVLHENRKGDDAPIIIAAQTNHALDQLLGHISHFEPNYVRLGGRSTNTQVKQHALYEIRQREKLPKIPGGLLGTANAQWKVQSHTLLEILEPLAQTHTKPFSLDTLFKLDVITADQKQSLETGAAQWVSTSGDQDDPLLLWLDNALIPFVPVYQPENFGFEQVDEDLEFEPLRENEAEHGVADEEDLEMLKGQWCSVNDFYTVSRPTAADLDKAKRMLDTTGDLWRVPEYLRGPMYLVMQQEAKKGILQKFRKEAIAYHQIIKDFTIGKWERDAVYLRRASIIGMTTTGLSKYRPLVASLKPKIVLIEEAAEVLEAPVTVACMDSLQHLVLVGDHQQLQGHCSVRALEGEPFFLNMSLFERLVNNGIPYKTLLSQRRMDPDFRRLISPLYPGLHDHPVVVHRPSRAWGMGALKSFFFDHQWSEYRDSTSSMYNEEEAKFIAGFYRYLIKNDVDPLDITILTFYNGQRRRIQRELKDEPEVARLSVKTVDSYQGEENSIVILSLVRSNDAGNIGFLDISNRVCVALSRAKLGFYLFGNANLLAGSNELWRSVITTMRGDPVRLWHQLPVRCQTHGHTILMQYPEDWHGNAGGCNQDCGVQLPCGHMCPLKCHPYSHEKVVCHLACTKKLICGHQCPNKCSESCFCGCEQYAQHGDVEGSHTGTGGPSYNLPGLQSGRWAWSDDWKQVDAGPNGNAIPSRHNGQNPLLSHSAPCSPQKRSNSASWYASGRSGIMPPPSTSSEPLATYRHGVRPLISSRQSQKSYSPSARRGPTIRSNSSSPDKQGGPRTAWTNFAVADVNSDDGVNTDDEHQGRILSRQDKDRNGPGTTILFDLSPECQTSPPKSGQIQGKANGRSIFVQEYQPASSQAHEDGNFTPINLEDGALSEDLIEL